MPDLLREAALALEAQTQELARLREETRWRKPEEEPAPAEEWLDTWVLDRETGHDFWTPGFWDGHRWLYTLYKVEISEQVVLRWRLAPSRPDFPELHGPASPVSPKAEARTSRSPEEIWHEIGRVSDEAQRLWDAGDHDAAAAAEDLKLRLAREHREAIARQQEVNADV